MENPVAVLMNVGHHGFRDELGRLITRLGMPTDGHGLPEQRLEVAGQQYQCREWP